MISPTFYQQLQPQLKFNSILQLLLISLRPCKSSRTPDGCHEILPTCSCWFHGTISLAKSWKWKHTTASFTVRFSQAKLLVSDCIWVRNNRSQYGANKAHLQPAPTVRFSRSQQQYSCCFLGTVFAGETGKTVEMWGKQGLPAAAAPMVRLSRSQKRNSCCVLVTVLASKTAITVKIWGGQGSKCLQQLLLRYDSRDLISKTAADVLVWFSQAKWEKGSRYMRQKRPTGSYCSYGKV